LAAAKIAELKPAEAARINETELASALEGEPRVGVRGNRCVRRGDKEAAGHAEVDDPLCVGLVCIRLVWAALP
jgi:hypothetical protein